VNVVPTIVFISQWQDSAQFFGMENAFLRGITK